jgi:2-oxo-3-hexenedioate decarboxylase
VPVDPDALARTIADAYVRRITIPGPTTVDPAFTLSDGYATEAALVRMRAASGHAAAGVKVGFANRAAWRAMKIETVLWAHMYDDTVHDAPTGSLDLSVGGMFAPKIEPEIIFKISRPFTATEPAGILASVDWLAIGFEIIDCVYPGWTFKPADFVAAYGLHAALVVGDRLRVDSGTIPALVDQLPAFTLCLSRNGTRVAEGSGKNSLQSPALCLGELNAAMARAPMSAPLRAGDLVSSGSLTDSQRITAGEDWRVEVDGLNLKPLTLKLT